MFFSHFLFPNYSSFLRLSKVFLHKDLLKFFFNGHEIYYIWSLIYFNNQIGVFSFEIGRNITVHKHFTYSLVIVRV